MGSDSTCTKNEEFSVGTGMISSESRVPENGMLGLMSGYWKRGTGSD